MSELTNQLTDHKFLEEPLSTEEKLLRNEAAGRINDLEKAILIWVTENPPELEDGQQFEDCEEWTADEQRVAWFIWNSNQLRPQWDSETSTFVNPWAQK